MARGVGGRGPANIMKHLKGNHYPSSKNEILKQAQQGPGPDTTDVISVLNKLPDKEYQSPADIMREIGKIE